MADGNSFDNSYGNSYDYERGHAELLGGEQPNQGNWQDGAQGQQQHQQAGGMTDINMQQAQMNEGTSKMEEITNILSMTQMRLSGFKKACGSLTNLLKIKAGVGVDDEIGKEVDPAAGMAGGPSMSSGGVASNMQQNMSGQLDRK